MPEVDTHKHHPQTLKARGSAVGAVPEAIARKHPNVSVIVMHYPPDD